MSALSQKQTSAHVRVMSSLPPKAGIAKHCWGSACAMSRSHLAFGPFCLMVNDIRGLTDQCGFQAVNQGFLAEGLAEEPDCPRCQYPRTCRLVGET